jgi:hypothetical protein
MNRLSLFRCSALVAGVLALPLLASAADTSPSTAGPVLCKDGTTAAHGGKGACSHHGGVDKSGKGTTGTSSGSPESTAQPSAAPTSPSPSATPSSSGTAVLCNDGTTATHSGRGACSWLQLVRRRHCLIGQHRGTASDTRRAFQHCHGHTARRAIDASASPQSGSRPGWRTRSRLGQYFVEGLPLQWRSLVRQDQTRSVHERG